MTLLLHILIALISVAFTSFVFVSPTSGRLKVSYALIGLTLASGTYLVLTSPAHMIQACVSGIVYVTLMTAMVMAAHRRQATSH